MKFRPWMVPVFLLMAGALSAQPVITDVLDGAALTANIAEGSVFVVKGTGLSPSGFVQSNAPAYPTLLNNVKVSLTSANGGTAIPVLMVYTYNYIGDITQAPAARINQLSLVVPSTVPVGAYDVRVSNGSATSAAFRTNVVARKPGIVSASGDGTGIAQATLQGGLILQRTSAQGSIAQFDTRPAHPGDVMTLWMTGLGPDVLADSGTGTAPDMTAAGGIRVVFDGADITPSYAGRSFGYPGLDQVNFTIPASVVLSCTNTVQVRAGGVSSNLLTIATSAASSTSCPAPTGGGGGSAPTLTQTELNTFIAAGQFRTGSASVSKTNSYIVSDNLSGSGGTTSSLTTSETFDASFSKLSGNADFSKYLNATYSGFVSGSCYIVALANPATVYPGLITSPLDAGASQSINGTLGLKTAPRSASATSISYDVTLPSGYTGPGTYTFSGPGGPDVGSYSTNYTIGGPELIWTNRTSITSIDRTKAQVITWSGGDPNGQVSVFGSSVLSQTVLGIFNCTAPTSAGSLTIPSAILSQLPASSVQSIGAGISFIQRGILAVSGGNAKRITVSGVDYFTIDHTFETSTSMQYK